MLSDRDIMALVQAGNASLFSVLVERHRPALLRFAAGKLRDAHLAEDAVQEAFLAAFAARDSYSPSFAFSTWMWTILLNLCRRENQRSERRTEVLKLSAESLPRPAMEDGRAGVLQQLARTEERSRLLLRLHSLPEEEADAIRLRFLGELPFDEIARAMGSSLGCAKMRVKRGLARLRDEMATEAD